MPCVWTADIACGRPTQQVLVSCHVVSLSPPGLQGCSSHLAMFAGCGEFRLYPWPQTLKFGILNTGHNNNTVIYEYGCLLLVPVLWPWEVIPESL